VRVSLPAIALCFALAMGASRCDGNLLVELPNENAFASLIWAIA